MGKKEIVTVTDDFDGTEGASTVRVGLDGREWEVDLSPTNGKELRDFLQHYIDVGRRLSQSGRAVSRVKTAPDNQAVRAWARVQGMTVSPRGRISADVVAQYEAAGH